MSNIFRKKGSLVILLAAGLFMAGQTWLSIERKSIRKAVDVTQTIQLDGVSAIRISRDAELSREQRFGNSMNIQYVEGATAASVTFNSRKIELKTGRDAGSLNLAFTMPPGADLQSLEDMHGFSFGGIKIVLPSSARNLEMSNSGGVVISTRSKLQLDALNVGMADCESGAIFKDLAVSKLTVKRQCQNDAPERVNSGNPMARFVGGSSTVAIQFEDATINSLNITTASGSIFLPQDMKPDLLQLNIGERVVLHATSGLLKKAKFAAPTE